MRSYLLLIMVTFALSGHVYAAPADKTSPFDAASTFIDSLVETHEGQELAKRELAAIPKGAEHGQLVLLALVRNGTRTKMKLNVMIGRLRQIETADPNFSTFAPGLADIYSRKAELYNEFVQAAKTLLAGPTAGVDYGKLAAHMPEVTAQIEFVDETIFKITPMVGLLLVSPRPDSKNHLSHLSITREQALKLVRRLEVGFGKSMDAKEPNWTASSASLLRVFLRDKGYQYSDDPWR